MLSKYSSSHDPTEIDFKVVSYNDAEKQIK